MASKTLTNKQRIDKNRKIIDTLMRSSMKNIDSINMLRHEIMSVEPMILSQPQMKGLTPANRRSFVQWANLKNLGIAYDYILEHKKTPIDWFKINGLHSILLQDTDVLPGFRVSMAKVLGEFAPSAEQIYYKIEQIQYHLNDKSYPVLTRAFDTHFEIIITQPYNDLNKRLARFVMNWFLIQHGYRPIIFNKKTDATEYTAALRARVNGDRRTYTEYMERSMLHTQTQIIRLLKAR
jgi:Fic family protein